MGVVWKSALITIIISIGFHTKPDMFIIFLSQLQTDDAENVSVSTLSSFSSTSLPLSDAAIQCGDQPESQQLNGLSTKNL